jgi:hypothetical protein
MANKKTERPSDVLKRLTEKASSPDRAIFFDFRKYCRQNLAVHRSDIYTHHLHPYPGKLLSYIPAFFLSDESIIPKNGIVLDPFCGSGTVLLESLVNPHLKRSAYGVEVNPLARLLSRVKTTPLSIDKLHAIKRSLTDDKVVDDSEGAISFKNMEMWFTKPARKKLQALASKINQVEAGPYRDFFLVCFSRVIRKCSLADPNIPPPVVLSTAKYKGSPVRHKKVLAHLKRSQNPDVKEIFSTVADGNIARLRSLNDALHNLDIRARVIGKDARDIRLGNYKNTGGTSSDAKKLAAASISAVITSPPYLTAQKYVRSTSLELLWLGLATDDSIASIGHGTIGNERAPRSMHISDDMDKIWGKYDAELPELSWKIRQIRKHSVDRAKDVALYFFNMKKVLGEMYRVLKKGAPAIIVMGNSKVLGEDFDTHRYLTRLAEAKGFTLKLTLRDPIRSRGMLSGRNITGGFIEDEYVLVLVK